MLNEDEKKLIKLLIEKEIADVEKEGNTLLERYPGNIFHLGEDKYEDFLRKLIKKL